MPPNASDWIPEVKICSAYDNSGIQEVAEMIEKFYHHQITNGYWVQRRKEQNLFAFDRLLNEQLHKTLFQKEGLKALIANTKEQIQAGTLSPYTGVMRVATHLLD